MTRVGVTMFSRIPSNRNYDNTPMQYTANFNSCKKDNFQSNLIYFVLIFAQNIDLV